MKVLELFAGSRSIGKEAEKQGCKVFSTDLVNFNNIDYVIDILKFDYSIVPFKPDMIWASPPCTGFSIASCGCHWTGGKYAYIPKTKTAKLGIELVKKTLEIINYYDPGSWFIENPRGLLRKMPFMQNYKRNTVTYCQYGNDCMKPTDIWTNNNIWIPKPMCKNGASCHISAPRGSKKGTEGKKNAFEKSKIPKNLCAEIITACK